MSPLLVIYTSFASSGIIVYFLNKFTLNEKKMLIGIVYTEWSSKFNRTIHLNWLRWILLILYLLFSISFVVVEPGNDKNYILFVLFTIFLSFSPRWTVVVGSRGIVAGMRIFLWKNLLEWKVLEKRRVKLLELKWASHSLPIKIKTKRIPLPKNRKLFQKMGLQ